MPQKVQIKRTSTVNSAPVTLDPGELSIEMADPTRLWVGVPTSLDPLGRKLIGGGVVVSDTPPLMIPGTLWFESDNAKLWYCFNDGTSTQWVQVSGTSGGGATGDFVLKTGDTMSGDLTVTTNVWVTGANLHSSGLLSVGNGVDPSVAVMSGGAETQLQFTTAALNRFVISVVDGEFKINRHNDTGVFVDVPLTISRATGDTTLTGDLIIDKATPTLELSAAAGGQSYVTFVNSDIPRWILTTHGDAGGDINFGRFDDAGNYLDAPMVIDRATGGTTFGGMVQIIGGRLIVSVTGLDPSIALRRNDTNTGVGIFHGTGTNDFRVGAMDVNGGATSTLFAVTAVGGATATNGWLCKAGSANPSGFNHFNIEWNVSANLWIDLTNVGALQVVSDYRIKKDVADLPSMWDTVKALRPVSYTHAEYTPPVEVERAAELGAPFMAADNVERWGFVAHELQETLIPSAASAEKDAPNAIQSLNLAVVVAALTKALQEAMAEIEALKVHVGIATLRRS